MGTTPRCMPLRPSSLCTRRLESREFNFKLDLGICICHLQPLRGCASEFGETVWHFPLWDKDEDSAGAMACSGAFFEMRFQSLRCLMFQAWAAGEAAIMRAMAVHGLLLARRASGSKQLHCI